MWHDLGPDAAPSVPEGRKELGWRCFGRTDAGVGAVSHVGDCLL